MLSTRSRIAMIAATVLGMSSSLPAIMPTGRVQAATQGVPRRRHGSLRYPFDSTRQHARHAGRQYTTLVNGFEIMNTAKRGANPAAVARDRMYQGWMREIPPVVQPDELGRGVENFASGSIR